MKAIAIGLLAMLLCACQTNGVREEFDKEGRLTAREYMGGDPNYAQYVAAASQQRAPTVDPVACHGDARCVENLAAFAALQAVASGGQANRIAPPVPKRTVGDRVEGIAKAALGVLPGLGGQYVALKSSDNSRDVALAQYGFLGGVVTDVTGAAATIAQSGPRIDVGGDYVGGDRTETNIGDDFTGGDRHDTDVGGDQVGGNQRIGDEAGRDIAGHDIIDNGGIIGDGNDQRQDSPGPIDNSDDGDDCTGSDCSVDPGDGG